MCCAPDSAELIYLIVYANAGKFTYKPRISGRINVNKKLSKDEKIKAIMDFYGLTRREAIIELEDMGILLDFLEVKDD
jgi:hypothetical protein